MENQYEMVEGTPVALGRRVYVIPALNLKMMRMLKDDLLVMQTGIPPGSAPEVEGAYMLTIAKIAHAALTRNYPNITLEEVEELIDMSNFQKVTGAITGGNDFKVTSESEGKVVLDKGRAAAVGESIGTASTLN